MNGRTYHLGEGRTFRVWRAADGNIDVELRTALVTRHLVLADADAVLLANELLAVVRAKCDPVAEGTNG